MTKNYSHSESEHRTALGTHITTPGVVLRARPYRDSDLIVHILTPLLGKIAVLARHARSSKKRFPNSLDLFDRGNIRLTTERSGALALSEFTASHSLARVRQDLDKLCLASLVCEVFDLVLVEEDQSAASEFFEVLDLSLNAIDEAAQTRDALRATFIALMTLCKRAGIADLSATSPGSRALTTLLDGIEQFCERPLLTRNTLRSVLKKAAA